MRRRHFFGVSKRASSLAECHDDPVPYLIKRVYDDPVPEDGLRILVDRLWPRGVSKERAALDVWLKDIAPSADLRHWFSHRPDRFAEFSRRYVAELHANPAVDELRRLADENETVTLLYSTKNRALSHAPVLVEFMESPS